LDNSDYSIYTTYALKIEENSQKQQEQKGIPQGASTVVDLATRTSPAQETPSPGHRLVLVKLSGISKPKEVMRIEH